MANVWNEKSASTALSRRLNEPGRPMSIGGSSIGGSHNLAFQNARDSLTKKFGLGHPAVMKGAVAAKGNQTGRISASTANTLVNHGGQDLLATSSIKDRLQAYRERLGLPAANGNRQVQIQNANALQSARQKGAIGGEITGRSVDPSVTSNSQSIRKALGDAAAGHQTHLDIGNGVASVVSSKAAPKEGFFLKLKGMAGSALGKFKSLPLGKKVAVGAGAGLLAMGAKTMMSSDNGQEKWASTMTNKYLEKIADDHMWRAALLGNHFQERAIAADHGKHVPFSLGDHMEADGKKMMAASDDKLIGAGMGGYIGSGVGLLGTAMTHKPGVHSPWRSLAGASLGALSGLMAGGAVGELTSGYKYDKAHAAKMHAKYASVKDSLVKSLAKS